PVGQVGEVSAGRGDGGLVTSESPVRGREPEDRLARLVRQRQEASVVLELAQTVRIPVDPGGELSTPSTEVRYPPGMRAIQRSYAATGRPSRTPGPSRRSRPATFRLRAAAARGLDSWRADPATRGATDGVWGRGSAVPGRCTGPG